jgi:5-methylcytosine-specific restriction endonuclease McrA
MFGPPTRTWEQDHKIYLAHKRRSERLAAAKGLATHSDHEWFALSLAFPRCVCCDDPDLKTGKDHIVPLYHGGSDGIENLQPLCASCNKAKRVDGTDYRPDDWRARMDAILEFAGQL